MRQYSIQYAWFGIVFLTAAVVLLVAAHAGAHWLKLHTANPHTAAYASPWEYCITPLGGHHCQYKSVLNLNQVSLAWRLYVAEIVMMVLTCLTCIIAYIMAINYLCYQATWRRALSTAVMAFFSGVFGLVFIAIFAVDHRQSDAVSNLIPHPGRERLRGTYDWGIIVACVQVGVMEIAFVLFLIEAILLYKENRLTVQKQYDPTPRNPYKPAEVRRSRPSRTRNVGQSNGMAAERRYQRPHNKAITGNDGIERSPRRTKANSTAVEDRERSPRRTKSNSTAVEEKERSPRRTKTNHTAVEESERSPRRTKINCTAVGERERSPRRTKTNLPAVEEHERKRSPRRTKSNNAAAKEPGRKRSSHKEKQQVKNLAGAENRHRKPPSKEWKPIFPEMIQNEIILHHRHNLSTL